MRRSEAHIDQVGRAQVAPAGAISASRGAAAEEQAGL